MSLSILHFADAHIDIANYGKHDPDLALPVRVVDFLKSLDQIVDAAIEKQVDLVIFAGDAYKDRNPQPTFQREWGKRIMRLSQAQIPTVLLVGNHDVSPASGRAHTLQEFNTLAVPYVHVADRITRLDPDQLGVPVQIITIPWVSRSQLMTREETVGKPLEEVVLLIEERVQTAVAHLIDTADPTIPLILTAHASVQGAKFGSERSVMLGHELVLSGSLVADKRLDYVALGHIHKRQDLANGNHPPIVYPGSIERIDFGEAKERKGYVLATINKGQTAYTFETVKTRRFIDLKIETGEQASFMDDIMRQLPDPQEVAGAICRVQLRYPRDWEALLDEGRIYNQFDTAFSIQLLKHRETKKRARLGEMAGIEALTPTELLTTYWESTDMPIKEIDAMKQLATEILTERETN